MAKRVVVIDDCKLTLRMVSDMLEGAGFEVLTAESGIEANPYIFSPPPPDLLLIDIELPMLRGDQKGHLLKSSEKAKDIPVILMSHKPGKVLERLARQVGVEGCIEKPLRAEALTGLIRRLLPQPV
jgi:CheY-like chemotaxis protein